MHARIHVCRNHLCFSQCLAKIIVTVCIAALPMNQFAHQIDEVSRVCAGVIYIADFFIIDEICERCGFRCVLFDDRPQCRVRRQFVVLPVNRHQAAIEANVSWCHRRHQYQLCRDEILFLDIVLVREIRQDGSGYREFLVGDRRDDRVELLTHDDVAVHSFPVIVIHMW